MMTTLPISIVGAKFLGSRDRIAVAGNVTKNWAEVRILGLGSSADSNDLEYSTNAGTDVRGVCTAMELCKGYLNVWLLSNS